MQLPQTKAWMLGSDTGWKKQVSWERQSSNDKVHFLIFKAAISLTFTDIFPMFSLSSSSMYNMTIPSILAAQIRPEILVLHLTSTLNHEIFKNYYIKELREKVWEGGSPIPVYTKGHPNDSHNISHSFRLVHALEWECKVTLNIFKILGLYLHLKFYIYLYTHICMIHI